MATASIPTRVLQEGEEAPLSSSNEVVIRITSKEAELFVVLSKLSLDLRVAGGWVRDKILGLETADIDIATPIPGVEVAERLKEYVPSLKMNVIQANVAQSKHLETATGRVLDLEVDFCPLRTAEVYEENSRIPTVQAGTPAQDALRRDFTLNSLFFNLTSLQIEDWTGQGLADLEARLLRTPCPAMETFSDDPLRVLRACRFAIRYQCTLDEDLRAAATNNQVHAGLQHKVSRERVGKELEGMLSGKYCQPINAVSLIFELSLGDCVFMMPPNADLDTRPFWSKAQAQLQRSGPLASQFEENKGSYSTRLLPLCVALEPLRGWSINKKGKLLSGSEKDQPLSSWVVQHSLKFSNQTVATVTRILGNVPAMESLFGEELSRLRVGRLLCKVKQYWNTCLLVAAIVADTDDWLPVLKFIQDQNLDECWLAKPLMNGKELQEELQLPRGPLVGQILNRQMDWMLEHPHGSRQECLEFLRDHNKRPKKV